MGAGTVIFEGVRRKPKRNRGPQKARSIAESENCARFQIDTDLKQTSQQQGDVAHQWERVYIFTMGLRGSDTYLAGDLERFLA